MKAVVLVVVGPNDGRTIVLPPLLVNGLTPFPQVIADSPVHWIVKTSLGSAARPIAETLPSRPPSSGWKLQLGKIPPLRNCRAFDLGGRSDPALAFEKLEPGPRADLAAIGWQQKTGPGDLVILEQEHAGGGGRGERQFLHGLLDGEFTEVGFAWRGLTRDLGGTIVLVGACGDDGRRLPIHPLPDLLAGGRGIPRDLVQHHVDDLDRPPRFEQQVQRVSIGQGD